MFVCICYGISDQQIRQSIDEGASNRQAIGEALGAGTCCGKCVDQIDALIIAKQRAREEQLPATAAVCHYTPAFAGTFAE